jgi:colicin import membrane protein
MLRQREKTVSWKAGALSVGVHGLLIMALLVSVNWKTKHASTIAEVELWDSLPTMATHLPPPEPTPEVQEKPKPEQIVKQEPLPKVEEPQLKEPVVDIALDKKLKALEQKKIDDKLKLEQSKKLAALKQDMLKDDQQIKDKLLKEQKQKQQNDAIKKLAQDMLAEDNASGVEQANTAKVAASAGVIDEFQTKIRNKIRSNVNKSLCGNGNPELKFEIGLLPTGQLNGTPKLIKSSGNPTCDNAVDRAIMASDPLPLPKDANLFNQFRSLKLTFRPNEAN